MSEVSISRRSLILALCATRAGQALANGGGGGGAGAGAGAGVGMGGAQGNAPSGQTQDGKQGETGTTGPTGQTGTGSGED